MTKFWLIILRIICILQALIAIFLCFASLFSLFTDGGFMSLLEALSFAFIAALPILAFTIYNNNYPDKLIEGRQKKYFNRIFLINFLLIAMLFGYIFRDYKDAVMISNLLPGSKSRSHLFFIPFIVSCIVLVFHFCILYGLYWLRRQINNNVNSKQFDFEEEND